MRSETDIVERVASTSGSKDGASGRIARVGRYDVLAELAQGGMGVVYRGVLRGDGGFTRPVAIKRLKPEHTSDPRYVAMLIDEAKISANVRSPNVIEVLDVVHEGTEFFIVMPFVAGGSLDKVVRALRERGISAPRAALAGIIVQVLRGLHAAHEAAGEDGKSLGIVHRDISPSNIHLGEDGVVRVLDFGVAFAHDRMQQETESGVRKGKPAYMSPEQLLGKANVDRRSDVFSTGVVFGELLGGARLFPNEILLSAMGRGEPLPKTLLTPLDAARLDEDRFAPYREVLERMLAVAPEQRFASAAAAAEAICAIEPDAEAAARRWTQGFLAENRLGGAPATDAPLSTEALSSTIPLPPPKARRRRGYAIAAVAVAALSLVVVVRATSSSDERKATAAPEPPPTETAPASSTGSVEPPPLPTQSAATVKAASSNVRPHLPVHAAPKHTASATKPDCRNPFTVAADGTKIPRRECF